MKMKMAVPKVHQIQTHHALKFKIEASTVLFIVHVFALKPSCKRRSDRISV